MDTGIGFSGAGEPNGAERTEMEAGFGGGLEAPCCGL